MNKCICCDKETEETVVIARDNGFCSSSGSEYLCEDCSKPTKIGDSWFVKIKDEIFYEYNTDYGFFGTIELVQSQDEFDYLVNKRKFDFLKGTKIGKYYR